MVMNVLNQVRCSKKKIQLIFHLLFSDANAAISAAASPCFCFHSAHFDDSFILSDKFSLRSQRRRRTDKSVSGLSSCLHVSALMPVTFFFHLTRSLTSFAVLPSESKWAIAAEGAPQVHAGSSVQTRVIVAEMSFGRAS